MGSYGGFVSSSIVESPPAEPSQKGSLGARVQSLRLPDRGSNSAGIAWTICYLALILAGWLGYRQLVVVPGQLSKIKKEAEKLAKRLPPANGSFPTTSTTSTAGNAPAPKAPPGTIALESKGYIIPAHQILVSPKVAGTVIELNIAEGRRVEKGEILAVIEATEYQADLDRAKAMVASAKQKVAELLNGNRPEEIAQVAAELGEAKAQLAKADADLKRATDLIKMKVIPPQDYDLAESQFKALKQRVERLEFASKLMQQGAREERREMAKAELQLAEADLAKAEWRFGNCTIRAPITGTILKKNAEEGNIVNPVAFNGSYSLCEMADLADLEVDLNIQERDVSKVFKGQKCRVRAEAFPERTYEGYVDRLMPIADRAKGAIPVRVKLKVPAEEEGVYLKPEMGAVVTFLADAIESTEPSEK